MTGEPGSSSRARAPAATADDEPWHTRTVEAVYERLGVDGTGLSTADGAARRSAHGPNRLPRAEPTPAWRVFLRQFRSPLIYVLLVAAVLSVAIGESTDAGFIALVLVVNALVGGVQEYRAERSAHALRQLLGTRATVVRDGEVIEVDGEDLVPGDLTILESGDRVPAACG